MNYALHYDRLISRARGRVIVGYKERHHVVPRCIRRDDSPQNLVDLTPEEHYVAHQLLVKMYPSNAKLIHAAILMSRRTTGNKAFGWLRRRKAAAMRGNTNGCGVIRSPEYRAKMSAALLGRKFSPEHRAKISAAGRRRIFSPEHRAKISAANTGKVPSAEARARMSAARRGKKLSPEHIENAAAGKRGKPLSQSHKAKLSQIMTSVETRSKISAAVRASWKRRKESVAEAYA